MSLFHDEVDRAPGKVVQGPGYSIKLCHAWKTLRYTRDERSIYVAAELVDGTREFGRTWLILPTYALVLTTPEIMRWDDGTPVDPGEENAVREQIASALNRIGQKYVFQIDDHQTEE